jgi:hypothetical protein
VPDLRSPIINPRLKQLANLPSLLKNRLQCETGEHGKRMPQRSDTDEIPDAANVFALQLRAERLAS